MSSTDRDDWGTGEDPRWDKNFSAPVYGTDGGGQQVTVSFGSGRCEGQTLIARGHVSEDDFNKDNGERHVGHDHYMPDGSPAGKHGDRGNYRFADEDSNSSSWF